MTQSYRFEFSFHSPTQIYFGGGRISRLKDLIPGNSRVLLLYGGGSIKANGIYDQVLEALAGHTWMEFGGVEPNPTLETLNRAVALVRTHGLDFILAVGGGSVIDGGKFVAAAAMDDGDAWDFLLRKRSVLRALPIGVVLTLAATGSESNGASVISRKATQQKEVFQSALLRPQFAILDPNALLSLPDRQIANGLVDAFVHACEQYLTYPVGALVQDGYAEAVLRSLYQLAKAFDQRRTLGWCQNMMWAANQALTGIIGVGVPQDWATHAIGLKFTALYDIDHARTLSIVQPAVLRETLAAKTEKLIQMGRNVFGMAEAGAPQVIDAIEQLYRSIDMPVRIGEAGVTDPAAAERIMAEWDSHDSIKLGERRDLDLIRIRHIVEAACRSGES